MAFGDSSAPASQVRGVLISVDKETDATTTTDFVQCCHCQRLWLYQPGSGRKRGWCWRCNGITCGCAKCDECVPFKQWLENVHRGLPEHHRPTTVAIRWEK